MTRENTDPSELTFEDSLAELEKIVSHLERGDVPLADSIRIYKRGAALKARCESQLKDAQRGGRERRWPMTRKPMPDCR